MKVTKKILGHLEKAYALAPIRYQGKAHFLVASELAQPCLLFDMEGNQKDVVWEKPGGVMSMVYVPGTDGQFLTTHRFYSFNDAAEAVISVVTPRGTGDWEIRTLAELPYVHRIDIVECGGVRYLIACQLKSGQEYDNDWRYPGKVFAAVLPEDLSGFDAGHPLRLTLLKDGMPRNHGYYRVMNGTVPTCILSADNGIFRFTPPALPGEDWGIEMLAADAASDAVLMDFDEDGEPELGVIAPFHGEKVRVYHSSDTGYKRVYEYEKNIPFCHGFWAGTICGKPRLIVGHRDGDRDLICFSHDAETGTYRHELLDHDVGTANLMVYRMDGKDVLISANREIDEIAMYILEPGGRESDAGSAETKGL